MGGRFFAALLNKQKIRNIIHFEFKMCVLGGGGGRVCWAGGCVCVLGLVEQGLLKMKHLFALSHKLLYNTSCVLCD